MGWLRKRSLVSAVILTSLIAGCGNNNSKADDAVKVSNQTTLPPIPFDARANPLISAAGQDVYVLQGLNTDMKDKAPLGAAFYDSRKKNWEELPPLPEILRMSSAHWTGKEFLVFGFRCTIPASIDMNTRFPECPRVVPMVSRYDPQEKKWSSRSFMPSIFPGQEDLEINSTTNMAIFGIHKGKIYLDISDKNAVLDGDSIVSISPPKETHLFNSTNCQVGSILVNLGIPENLYDADDFINNISPDGRLPSFHQLAMETVDLADKNLTVQKIAMPDKKLLKTEIQDFENTRVRAVCTSSKVLLIAPNSGPLFSWDPDTKEWSASNQATTSVSTSTSFPLQELNLPIVSGERLMASTYGKDGERSYTQYDAVSNRYKKIEFPLKVDGETPAPGSIVAPYQGTFLMYQNLPGSPSGEFTVLSLF